MDWLGAHHRHRSVEPMDWTALRRVTAPVDAIMTLAEAKKHLRVDHSDDDDYINGLIDVATAWLEGPAGIGLALVDQTWQLRLDHLPRRLRIGMAPLQAVTSVTVDGETIDPTAYTLVNDELRGTWISRLCADVTVTFTCGYGDDLPADLVHAAKLIIGHLYNQREGTIAGGKTMEVLAIPLGVDAILSRYRRY